MKKLRLLLSISMIIATTSLFSQTSVDLEKSVIEWTGSKIGGSHNGTVQLKEAKLEMHDNHLHGGHFVIDMTSIKDLDISKEKDRLKLEGHLKSDDFFGVEKFPEAHLKITEEASFIDGLAHIHADLTIKGKTHPIHFEAKHEGNKINATITVDRSKYDVRYGSKSFFDNLGNRLIHDDFVLEVSLSLK